MIRHSSKMLILALSLSLSACAKWGKGDTGEDASPFQGMTAKQLFTEANDYLSKEQYDSAAKRYDALETMYPFSDYAEQAEKNLIYAYYQKEDYASAAATAERFIHLYPRTRNVDYAYYMKGLSNFQQSRGTFSSFLPLDESWRDPGTQTQAYTDFATLIQKFPESSYKANALQRMIYLRNQFAKRELNTANYYYERKKYVAAVARANAVIKNYPQAPSAKKALALIYHANKAMGLQQAAADALNVYQSTYHQHPTAIG